jgi:FkbH-like protein
MIKVTPNKRVRRALDRAAWQPVLFNAPNRAELLDCIPQWECRKIRVRVHRNHGFEPVSSGAGAFAAWNRYAFDWILGGYDDTLSFDLPGEADVELIWLDVARLSNLADAAVGGWLAGRVRALRATTANPILVLAWPLSQRNVDDLDASGIAGVHVADLHGLAASLEGRWLEPRTASISGTRLGNRACLAIARELACCWLPAAIAPSSVKAVAVDLDDTLYRGVLGEDGAAGIELTAGHQRLQERLVRFRRDGGLLALVSRNEPEDVARLFADRGDFPLRFDDFSVVEASWDDKGIAVERVAQGLHIGTDAVVYIDDNPGELLAVALATAAVTVHARPDGAETEAALSHVAGLFRWRASREDALRASDLRADDVRQRLADEAVSAEDYWRGLRVRLSYYVGRRADLPRLAELVSKTNQFNLSLRRSSEAQIARRLDERPSNVIAIGLADRLSDSGIVAAVVGAHDGRVLRVEEACVSCRALGRRLEDVMLTQALLLLAGEAPADHVVFAVAKGERNEPARRWLARYAGATLEEHADCLSMPFDAITSRLRSPNVAMEIIR